MSAEIAARLRQRADASRVAGLQRFFKTGPGQYAEGDVFIGVTVPHLRQVCRECRDAAIPDIRAHLAIFNRALDGRTFLHGNRPHLDDFILMPMIDALLAVAPEGPELVAEAPNVAGHRATFLGRPSYHATIPQMFRKAA